MQYSQPEEPLPPPPSETNVVNDVYAVPKKAPVSCEHHRFPYHIYLCVSCAVQAGIVFNSVCVLVSRDMFKPVCPSVKKLKMP